MQFLKVFGKSACGMWDRSQFEDVQPMVQALPQRARQDGVEAPNEADAA